MGYPDMYRGEKNSMERKVTACINLSWEVLKSHDSDVSYTLEAEDAYITHICVRERDSVGR